MAQILFTCPTVSMKVQPGSCQTENGAVTSAVPVHLRVEPAHFDWRWRERPALALLAWEACFAIRWRR